MHKILFFLSLCATVLFANPAAMASNVTAAPDAPTLLQQAVALNTQIKNAMLQVIAIVNQPVTHIQRSSLTGSLVGVTTFGPGWFHPGAKVPDYNTVDVRKTRELPYAKYLYVTSDVNPGEVFIGEELEFNPMTKYFYTDRKNPKKKLSEAEMLKINALYRAIGQYEQQLAQLQAEQTALANPPMRSITDSPYFTIALFVMLVLIGAFLYRKWYR